MSRFKWVHLVGIILYKTNVDFFTGSSLEVVSHAQTAVSLGMATINANLVLGVAAPPPRDS
jgi:hypothetical protein